jgi:SAM-dependent methyltransferase
MNRYMGSELPLFLEAERFHQYYIDLFGEWISGNVLEVGAGQGAITHHLLNCKPRRLTACEPDPEFVAVLRERLGTAVEIVQGGLADVPAAAGPFDVIVYVDVLEHIRHDRDEVRRAAARLGPGGLLILGGPAHAWLYSRFDAAIGHCRRYNRRSVEALVEASGLLRLEQFRYFDSVGMVLSLGNRYLIRRDIPSQGQIRFWNNVILPVSRSLDPVLGYRVGKSFVAIARQSFSRAGETRGVGSGFSLL